MNHTIIEAMAARVRDHHVDTGDSPRIRLRICAKKSRVPATSAICSTSRQGRSAFSLAAIRYFRSGAHTGASALDACPT